MIHRLHNYDEQTLSIQHALKHCEDMLTILMHTVYKQHWQQLSKHTQAYEHAIAALKIIMQDKHELPSVLLHQFQYLSTQQRRVMRSIHQHMQQTNDDITSINQGLSKLRQASHL